VLLAEERSYFFFELFLDDFFEAVFFFAAFFVAIFLFSLCRDVNAALS